MIEQLRNKHARISVVGLGYVGLPIALEFGRHFHVTGFDIDPTRIEALKNNVDPGGELPASYFENSTVDFTTDIDALKHCNFHIIAVPTPVDEHKVPDLSSLQSATQTIASILKKGDYVVFESTVYPGCTEDICLPILESVSGLKVNTDFKLGYSPERINPGDDVHTLRNVMKIVSGSDKEALETISDVYVSIVQPGVYQASSIKVAEAAKILENTQRDLNIALMNELSIILDKMGVNTYEVIEAAGTKWNFHKYKPGLVGGHCIGVDPYYLTYKSKELGYDSRVILAGRVINDSMGAYVAKKILQHIIQNVSDVKDAKVLVMGATFKENVSDIRNSKVADVVNELKSFSLNVEVTDPHADSEELNHEYGFGLTPKIANDYDAVIVTVPHLKYKELDEKYFNAITKEKAVIADLKGIYRNKISERAYWSL